MKVPSTKLAIATSIFVLGSAAGIWLIRFSEADDAPGGVVIGLLLMVGALALALRIGARRTTGR